MPETACPHKSDTTFHGWSTALSNLQMLCLHSRLPNARTICSPPFLGASLSHTLWSKHCMRPDLGSPPPFPLVQAEAEVALKTNPVHSSLAGSGISEERQPHGSNSRTKTASFLKQTVWKTQNQSSQHHFWKPGTKKLHFQVTWPMLPEVLFKSISLLFKDFKREILKL